MRIELDDWNAQRHSIDTMNARLAGEWFAEWAMRLMSVNAAIGDCRLRVWPSTQQENELIGQQDIRLNQNDMLELAGAILAVSGRLAEIEASEARR